METISIKIPQKQKAMVYDDPGNISTKMEMLHTPEPGPGEVLVNLTHSGVCHSDLAVMTVSWKALPFPTQKGQVGGHEGVGNVVKLGPGAELTGIKIGDRVGVKWIASACGRCDPCYVNSDGLCFNQKISGYYTPGTFQQYVVSSASYVTPIPNGIESAAAAPVLCAGLTAYSALRKSQSKAGDWVVISGAGGGLGHLATQIGARALGFRIIGIDHSSKRELVISSGAEYFVDISSFCDDHDANITAHVKTLTGRLGAHAVINCTGSNKAYAEGLDFLRFNGTLVCVGMPEGSPVSITGATPSTMITQQRRIVGSNVGNRLEAIEVLEYAARGIIKPHYQVEKMESLTQVFHNMHSGKLQGRVVLDLS